MNIILLGAPGSGKGTQSEHLIEKLGMTQLSTGDLFRKNIAEKTPLGQEAQGYMNAGKYVPDSVTNGMVADFLATKHNKLIFDGYPRTLDQAHALDEMLSKHNSQIDKVFLLDIDEALLMNRLTGRLVCPVCKRSYHKTARKPKVENKCDFDGAELVTRPDDAPDKIATRLQEYNTLTAPLIAFYEAQGKLVRFDGTHKSSDAIFLEMKEVLQ